MNQNYDSGNYTRGFIFGAIIGGAVGAITALLLAPKSGSELRRDIAQRSGEFYDKAYDYFDNMQENVGTAVNTTVNEGRLRAERIINNARNQAEDLLKNAENVLQEARNKAGSVKGQVQDKIEHLREAAKASAEAFKTEMSSNNSEKEEEV